MNFLTDWDVTREAALYILRGLNPMSIPGFYSPPWICLAVMPLAVLPRWVGYVAVGLIMLMVAIVAVKRLGGDIWAVLLLCTTPFLLHNVLWGNFEWVPLMGMLMPPVIGLVWVATKPQSGIGTLIYYLARVVRRQSPITIFIPLGVVGALTWLLYNYPFSVGPANNSLTTASYAIFPWGVPFGLALIAWAIKREDVWLAYAASPLLAPYFTSHTLIGPFLVLVTRSKRWACVAWVAAWVYAFATIGKV